jgi:hypothetical protein
MLHRLLAHPPYQRIFANFSDRALFKTLVMLGGVLRHMVMLGGVLGHLVMLGGVLR